MAYRMVGKTQRENEWKAAGFRFAYDTPEVSLRPADFAHDSSTIDGGAAPVVPWKKEEADVTAEDREQMQRMSSSWTESLSWLRASNARGNNSSQRSSARLDRIPDKVAERMMELLVKEPASLSLAEGRELATKVRHWLN